MGSDTTTFAGVLPKSRDRKWRQSHVRKYIMRMRNRKLRNILPSRAFWSEVTKSRDWKRPCPEVALTGSRFCACPDFPRAFFLIVVTWLPMWPKVTWPPSEFPWVCATGSCATPVVTEGDVIPWKCPWVFSTTSASYSPRKPHILYLAWWLELALVICPFYFHIVST